MEITNTLYEINGRQARKLSSWLNVINETVL